MLDGAIRIGDLIEKTKEYGMNAVAVTDHGAMYGALEFYTKAKKAGLRPIIGCELYIAETDHLIHDKTQLPPRPLGDERRRLPQPDEAGFGGADSGLLLQAAH